MTKLKLRFMMIVLGYIFLQTKENMFLNKESVKLIKDIEDKLKED